MNGRKRNKSKACISKLKTYLQSILSNEEGESKIAKPGRRISDRRGISRKPRRSERPKADDEIARSAPEIVNTQKR